MSYKALYRTYRPQKFADVTGQEVVVQTLQNAIKNKKISHAYLFSGPRGTGKTSVARIFAKALNCANLKDGEPCDECISCREISEGYNPDVIEIDAASNNGVDEIRDIREKVKFLPSGSKYKIYIIDEVHMLSGGAFNALLKTLEEPPKHAVFILATTEPQKLPATIISRCQRFEFKSLGILEINSRLKQICEFENVSITDEALNLIAEAAEGAMRDAISILDQAISYGNKEITIDDVNSVTGSLNYEKVISLTKAIEGKEIHTTLSLLNELISSGKEINKIINSLLVFYRDILLYKSVGNDGYNKFIFSKESFQEFANNIVVSKVMYFIDVLCDVQSKVKYSTTPNIFLEIALIKMCNISVEDLDVMKRLTELEEKVTNGGINNIVADNSNGNFNNEKVTTLELRVNQIINELNKLEIRKQIEKISILEQNINNVSQVASMTAERDIKNQLQHLQDKVSEMELFSNKEGKDVDEEISNKINDLETKVNNLVVNNTNNTEIDIDMSGIYERLELLENSKTNNVTEEEINNKINNLETKVNNLPFNNSNGNQLNVDMNDIYKRLELLENNINVSNNDISYNQEMDKITYEIGKMQETILSVLDDINSLKEKIVKNENNVYDYNEHNIDLTEISNKLMFLEKRMYQIIAGELATHKANKKEHKKNNGQIMLFDDEVLNINDLEQTRRDYDFGDLQKVEEEIRTETISKEIEIENIKPVESIDEPETVEEIKEESAEIELISNVIDENNQENVISDEKSNDLLFNEQISDNIKEVGVENKPNDVSDGLFESDIEFIPENKEETSKSEIVSQYFDVDKGHEVINKEKSTLVLAGRKENNITSSLEKDIIALEKNDIFSRPKEDPVAINNDIKEDEDNKEKIVVEKIEPKRDKFASYNIKDIEQILHDSRIPESKNDKARIEQVWKNMTRGARPEQLSVIETLQEGQVAAVGNKEFIIVFSSVSLCNIVMRRKFKDIAIHILYNLLGDTYDYVALPTETWVVKSKEYKQQYAIGIKAPTLKPIEVEGLEIRNEDEYQTETDKIIDKTIKLFGEGNIDIE